LRDPRLARCRTKRTLMEGWPPRSPRSPRPPRQQEEEEEEKAEPSSKKLKKGGQQKIDFPKVAKAATTHPASTGIMGLLLGMLIMGFKSIGGKRM
jgi:hypothetical protein